MNFFKKQYLTPKVAKLENKVNDLEQRIEKLEKSELYLSMNDNNK